METRNRNLDLKLVLEQRKSQHRKHRNARRIGSCSFNFHIRSFLRSAGNRGEVTRTRKTHPQRSISPSLLEKRTRTLHYRCLYTIATARVIDQLSLNCRERHRVSSVHFSRVNPALVASPTRKWQRRKMDSLKGILPSRLLQDKNGSARLGLAIRARMKIEF